MFPLTGLLNSRELGIGHLYRISLAMLLTTLFVSNAHAKEPVASGKTSFDLSLTPFYQFPTSIDGGGEFKQSSALLRFKAKRSVSPTTSIGLNLKYDVDDYDFSGTSALGSAQPWNDVRRFGVSVPIFLRMPNNWSVSVSPAVDWLQEQGADSSESLSYGLTTFLLKSWARDKSLGLGAGVFKTVDDDIKVFPFIAVDWRLNERWRVANPFDADALGPAGLELIYSFNEQWHLGGGGVYRSFRFRLDDEGIAPNGTGENQGAVAFLRLRRLVSSGINVDLYGGAILGGKLELKNGNGDALSSADYDTAPFAAITFRMEF